MNEKELFRNETARMQSLAIDFLSKVLCEKCGTKSIWFHVENRDVEYEFCCKELNQKINEKLSDIGMQFHSSTIDGRRIDDNS